MSSEKQMRGARLLQTEPFLYLLPNEAADTAYAEDASGKNGAAVLLAAQMEQKEREEFERGVQTGESRANGRWEARLKSLLEGVPRALGEFQQERRQYFERVEPEVVQLALAIARKILHREAQMDPLLLTGLVHVALEKLDAGTRVRLRANPADMHFWNTYAAQKEAGMAALELLGDASLKAGECALETEVGSTLISLETQLKEIEQGFFDLLEQRPKGKG